MKKGILFMMIVLNTIVLMGQIWPDGAPPFSRIVNIVFLGASFFYFVIKLSIKDKEERQNK